MRYIFCLLACLMLLSCKNEEEVFHSLQFDVAGINLSYNDQTGTFDGTIPSNGCVFTLTGKGDFADFVYVSSIKVNGIPLRVDGMAGDLPRPLPESSLILNGEWGKVEYLTNSVPYVIKFNINPNSEASSRLIDIQLGYGYWCSHIKLEQSS